ncbi:MAG TPA: glycosyltransferase family 39 protein [Verrucomicrobiae bacterium]
MDQPTATASRNFFARLWPWLVVLGILLFVGFIRVRLLDMPLERDEGEYAYAGQLILQGIPPYELAYNMKLPGTYYAYAAGMALFGQTPSGIHLTLLVVNALTIIFVFLLGRKLFGVTTGLVAGASYALMSVSTAVLGMATHATQFVVLFAVPGTLLMWRALESGKRRAIFFSGLLYGLAFVMIQQGIFFGIFGVLVLLWRARAEASTASASLKQIFIFLLGAGLPFGALCLYLAGMGIFPQFWFWTFSYARAYAMNTSPGEGLGYLLDYLRDQFAFFVGFWILAAAGLLAALRHPANRKQISFAVLFLFFSILGTIPGLNFRPHYFVLALPAFTLVIGIAIQFLQSSFSRRMKIIPVILFVAVIAWGVYLQRGAFFELPPPVLNQVIYKSNPFVESVTAAKYIREHSPPDARIAVIGSEPQIYFYARRHSATGYIYTYPLMENQPYAPMMQRQMIREIESSKPEFLVMVVNRYSWMLNKFSDVEILDWAQKYAATNYDRIGILEFPLGKPEIQLWGDDAKNYRGTLKQHLDIYQRKPDAR